MNVKLFQRFFDEDEGVFDKRINDWIINQNVDVIDVKISTCFDGVGVVTDVMVVYSCHY